MARRYRSLTRVDFHAAAAADAWAAVIETVREAAEAPNYSGPSPASVEAVAVGIEEVREAVRAWLVEIAEAPRLRRLRPAERAAIAGVLAARRGA